MIEQPTRDDDKVFEERAQRLLAQSVLAIPGATQSRLTKARYAALAAAQQRRDQSVLSRWLTGRWLPAGAASAALLALVTVTLLPGAGHWSAAGSSSGMVAVNAPLAIADQEADLLADIADEPASGGQAVDADYYEWAAARASQTDPAKPL